MQFPVEAYQAEISQIIGDVFLTMLGQEVSSSDSDANPPPGTITAAILFAGTWKGAILVQCSEDQVRAWTSTLGSIEVPDRLGDDVQDAVVEIVNMVGGNLKSVLPGGVGISMPAVVRGNDYSMKICGGNRVSRQCFSGEHGLFWVTFVEVIEP